MKICVVCDTIGCCDDNEQHTYEEGCILDRNSPRRKVITELETLLAAVKEVGGPHDKNARRIIRNRMTEDGQLVISNRILIAELME
jgi:hypothetical protein